MASDYLYNEFVVDGFDLKLNGEIFLTGGVMNPKELYLQDLTLCQDTSSSDSGISAVDDALDIANITDLNSILDTDLSLDCALLKFEEDNFDADIFFKSEPHTPASCHQHDLIFPDDATVKDEWSPLTFPECLRMDDSLSPASSANSPQQIYTIQQSPPEPVSPVYESPSPSLTLTSQTLQFDSSASSDFADFTYSHILPSNNQTGSHGSLYAGDRCRSPGAAPGSSPDIIIFPNIKKENNIRILPSPGGAFVSSNGNVKLANVNIDSILNSKIKIKPKPGSEVIIPTGSPQWVTAAGNTQLSFSSQQAFPIISASSVISGAGVLPVTDEKVLKRAQRVIKNRESASLSRKRKKEYLTSLEQRLQQCRDENERLHRENETLKQQLQSLQTENTVLKHTKLSPAKKMCLMCVTLLLVLNITPFSFMNESTSTSSRPGISQNYHTTGRHLMSLHEKQKETDSTYEDSSGVHGYKNIWSPDLLMQFDEEISLLADKLNITAKLGNMCPMYFNTTESNRLAEQLRRWMISQEEEKQKKERKQHKKKKDYPPMRRFDAGFSNRYTQFTTKGEVDRPTVAEHNYPVQVFGGSNDPRQQLLNAIPRRNDTFYVLSFSTDYFLVPATAHNKTMRPRMSLLMPVITPPMNDTTREAHDSIGMMQINCEILSTNIISVLQSTSPENADYNSTAYARNDSSHKSKDHGSINIHSKRERNNAK